MLPAFENLPVVGPLTLEDAGGVVQAMREDMYVGFAPRHQLAVHPDQPVAIIICARHVQFLQLLFALFFSYIIFKIMKKINSRTYFSKETQKYLDEVMEWILDNPANQKWL